VIAAAGITGQLLQRVRLELIALDPDRVRGDAGVVRVRDRLLHARARRVGAVREQDEHAPAGRRLVERPRGHGNGLPEGGPLLCVDLDRPQLVLRVDRCRRHSGQLGRSVPEGDELDPGAARLREHERLRSSGGIAQRRAAHRLRAVDGQHDVRALTEVVGLRSLDRLAVLTDQRFA
jgi:hypothetical protein